MRTISAITVCLALVTGVAHAHTEIDQQVAGVTAQLEVTPDDPALYHRRAELHAVHREYPLALADFDRALALDPARTASHIGRSSSLLKTDKPSDALAAADRALALAPDSPAAHLARARALTALGKIAGADAAFTASAKHDLRPTPGLFLEHAAALRDAPEPNRRRAIEVLEQGMDTVGPVVTLAVPTYDLHLATGDPAAALALCHNLPPVLEKTPAWLLRRATALTALGRHDHARMVLEAAQSTVARLPVHRRSTQAIRALAADIDKALASLPER